MMASQFVDLQLNANAPAIDYPPLASCHRLACMVNPGLVCPRQPGQSVSQSRHTFRLPCSLNVNGKSMWRSLIPIYK